MNRLLIELGALGILVLAIAAAIFLIRYSAWKPMSGAVTESRRRRTGQFRSSQPPDDSDGDDRDDNRSSKTD